MFVVVWAFGPPTREKVVLGAGESEAFIIITHSHDVRRRGVRQRHARQVQRGPQCAGAAQRRRQRGPRRVCERAAAQRQQRAPARRAQRRHALAAGGGRVRPLQPHRPAQRLQPVRGACRRPALLLCVCGTRIGREREEWIKLQNSSFIYKGFCLVLDLN